MKRIISLIICALMIVLSLTACDSSSKLIESYNHGVIIVNNSSKDIKAISVHTNSSNETGMNADNSPLKKGDYLYFELGNGANLSFTIEVEDTNGKKYKSDMFSRNLNYNALYYFYIIDSEDGSIAISD